VNRNLKKKGKKANGMKMMMNNMTDDQFKKINCLISSIEINLKKCSKKFKDKQEVDYLLIDLTNFLAQENISELKLQDEIGAIEKNLRKISIKIFKI